MAGDIFVSYSRQDSAYATNLMSYLRGEGLQVWLDEETGCGERWDQAIREKIADCAAFIVIMTPSAEESDWVQEELTRAKDCKRRIFPLLLSGKPFFGLATRQYFDVTSGQMPNGKFIPALRDAVGIECVDVTHKASSSATLTAASPTRTSISILGDSDSDWLQSVPRLIPTRDTIRRTIDDFKNERVPDWEELCGFEWVRESDARTARKHIEFAGESISLHRLSHIRLSFRVPSEDEVIAAWFPGKYGRDEKGVIFASQKIYISDGYGFLDISYEDLLTCSLSLGILVFEGEDSDAEVPYMKVGGQRCGEFWKRLSPMPFYSPNKQVPSCVDLIMRLQNVVKKMNE
jgi:hypothetical protein